MLENMLRYEINHKEFEQMKNKLNNQKGFYIGIGLMGGVLVGIFTDNIGLWISLGLVFGVVLDKNNNKSDKEQQDE